MMFWIAAAILSVCGVAALWRGLFAGPVTRRVQITALCAAIAVPAVALMLYDRFGSPDMPDFPRRLQPQNDVAGRDAALLQERPLIRLLRADPQNEKSWLKLMMLYGDTGQPERLRQAYDDALDSVPQPAVLREAWVKEWVERHVKQMP